MGVQNEEPPLDRVIEDDGIEEKGRNDVSVGATERSTHGMHEKIRVNVEELPINSSSFLRSKDQSTILRKCEAETVLRLLHLINPILQMQDDLHLGDPSLREPRLPAPSSKVESAELKLYILILQRLTARLSLKKRYIRPVSSTEKIDEEQTAGWDGSQRESDWSSAYVWSIFRFSWYVTI
uniref:Uncharacterized protein n=1 Tax=Pristionchus pacificus TaxID=54126 RepID=A0A2A6C8X7_PRIPA|eukprot:PDM74609.1 hypothetical protein PRIPAC_41965 [Pristionchus pacificus]